VADIGEPQREVTFEPLPDSVPLTEPAPAAPAENPELVPA
jgi:hypothetical protein